MGGTTRNYAAAVGTDGTLQSWNPNVSSTVCAVAVSGSTVYLGGSFTTVGGTARNYAAAVGTDGTLASPWPALTGAPVSLDTSSPSVARGTTVKGSVNLDDTLRSTVGGYAWQRCSTLNDASSCQDINSSEGGTTGAWWGSRNADIGQQVRLKATWDDYRQCDRFVLGFDWCGCAVVGGGAGVRSGSCVQCAEGWHASAQHVRYVERLQGWAYDGGVPVEALLVE